MIKQYKKGANEKLSANFNSNEFDCHGVKCCTSTLIDTKLVDYLQKIRNHFGKPVVINSGYRCPSHNKTIGGATGSRHTKGEAADIAVNGIAPAEVAKYAESIGVLGIGLYETAQDGYFVHIDTRTYKSFWYGHAEKPMSTFGGKTEMLSNGSRGEAVKTLQQNLNLHGYKAGTADGIFGKNTAAAVQHLQTKHNLEVDGIVGPDTNEVIYQLNKKSFTVQITAIALNVRTGPGTKNAIVAYLYRNAQYKIIEEKDGWGRIDGLGWISLKYTKKV